MTEVDSLWMTSRGGNLTFACLNAGIIPAVYMFFPGKSTISLPEGRIYQFLSLIETAGRSLGVEIYPNVRLCMKPNHIF